METTFYNVKNRSISRVVYTIPEEGIRREFSPGETKRLSFEELEKLTYQPGGRELMRDFLQIKNATARERLELETEAEYDMSEEQIANLILSGSQAQFLDCLDFAPVGVIDLIKTLAIKLPMTDSNKMEALKNKTGFDVAVALANIKEENEEPKSAEPAPTTRTGRRTEAPNYSTEEEKSEEEKPVITIKKGD